MSDAHAQGPVELDDEPRSPMWLPALGAGVFVMAALAWAVTPAALPPVPAADEAAASASASASATPPPAPARPAQPSGASPHMMPPPAASAGAPRRPVPPPAGRHP